MTSLEQSNMSPTLSFLAMPLIKFYQAVCHLAILVYWLVFERFSTIGRLAHQLERCNEEEAALRVDLERLNERYRADAGRIIERRQALIDRRVEVIQHLAQVGMGEHLVETRPLKTLKFEPPGESDELEQLPTTPSKQNVASISQLFEAKLNPYSRQRVTPEVGLARSLSVVLDSPPPPTTRKFLKIPSFNRDNLKTPPSTATERKVSTLTRSSTLPHVKLSAVSPPEVTTTNEMMLRTKKPKTSKKITIRRQSSLDLLNSSGGGESKEKAANEPFERLVTAVLADYRRLDSHLEPRIKALYEESPLWRAVINDLRRQYEIFSRL